MKQPGFKISIVVLGLPLALTLAFQGCGHAQFTAVNQNASTSGVNGLSTTPVVCNPLSTTTGCGGGGGTPGAPGGPGLLGNVYNYPNGTDVNSYITKGKRLNVLVQLTNLDIPLRSWTAGFQGPNGGILDDNGNLLIEYFALDLAGFFQLPATSVEQDYQFAIASDDGSILSLDGNIVVNNDGTHPIQWKCAPQAFTLTHAKKHTMGLKYYQGPRYDIALQVYLRPWADHGKPCDASGGFTIVPAAGLSH